MSPKSRGRAGRAKPKKPQKLVQQSRPGDLVLRKAAPISDQPDALMAELWAGELFGVPWEVSPIGDQDSQRLFCLEVVDRALTKHSPAAFAALAALRRIAPESEFAMLDEAIDRISQLEPAPPWFRAPAYEPVRAWQAVNVWDSERVLFIDFENADPAANGHTLMAHVLAVAHPKLTTLRVLELGAAAAWAELQDPGDMPLPLVELPVAEVLADLADCLRSTDLVWPRPDDEDLIDVRALAWTRAREFLPEQPVFEPMAEVDRETLTAEFLADPLVTGGAVADVNQAVLRSLAEIFLEFGDRHLNDRPLGWSPQSVELLLSEWLPRNATVDPEQRAQLPETLRCWLQFALQRRKVEQRWIDPVVAEIDHWLPIAEEAFGG